VSTATLADVLDRVRWDYDPARQVLSPLVVTARWFENFPWEGEDEDPPAQEERG
jgi:hypothetical protein